MPSANALLKLSRALHGVQSLETLMERVRESMMETTRYLCAYLHLINPDHKTFEIVGWVSRHPDLVRHRLKMVDVSKDKLIQLAESAREPFVIEDLRKHPFADQKQVEFFGNRTSICVPMFDGDDRIGPLVIATYADQGVMLPTPEEFDFLVQIGSLVSVVIVRMRAEAARQEAESRASDAERMQSLGKLAGEVAHDFNNLLMSILANVELAMEEVGPHSARELLEDVRSAATRGGRLTRQLLAFSRGQVLRKRELDVDGLIKAVAKLASPTMGSHIRLNVHVSPELPPLQADGDQLERALLNLVVNARDAIGSKPGNVSLDAELLELTEASIASQRELKPGRYVVLSVSDDGAGIPPELRARIFEPFFTTKGTERGTGLGLAVVDGVVRQHDGSLHLYSEVGHGTTFKLFLPIEGAIPERAPQAVRVRHANEVILVVDDDEQVRRSVERVLLRAGHTVHTASTAEEGLEILARRSVSMLLTDVVLPGKDGVALAAEANSRWPTLTVRYMTGYARGRAATLNAPHLSKPFSSTELLRLVDEALGRVEPARGG